MGEGKRQKGSPDAAALRLLAGLPVPLGLLTAEGTVAFWNAAAERASGWSAAVTVGRPLPGIASGEEAFRGDLAAAVAAHTDWSEPLAALADGERRLEYRFADAAALGGVPGTLVLVSDRPQREFLLEQEIRKGSRFTEVVLHNLPIGLAINTIDQGSLGFANRMFLEVTGGWKQGDFTDLETFFARIYPDPVEREQVRLRLLQDIASGDLEKMHWDDLRITTRDGRERILAMSNIPLTDMNLLITTVQDVTEQKLTERALRDSERRYQVMAEASPVGIFRVDAQGRCCHVNQRWVEVSGLTMAQVQGRSWTVAVHPGDRPEVREAWLGALERREPFKTECRFKIPGGTTSWIFCQVEPLFDGGGSLEGYIGSLTDISPRKRSEEEIRQLAYYDTLTGLPNRSFFREQLERALATARRHRQRVALLFCDLDNFKDINDSLGHDRGDLLLKAIAVRLSACIRRGDTLCRLGGDEFVLLLPTVGGDREIVAVTRKIRDAMKDPFDLDGNEVHTTTSIGIAVHPEDGASVQTLLKHADMAMYAAKGRGRNRYQFFSEDMNRRALERMKLEAGLRQALERGELSLAWQPQLELVGRRLVGVEALLRWRHPELGDIRPAQFIPVAEETGLIHRIGEWVLQEACAQARRWQERGLGPLRVAVNLSASQFLEPKLVELIERILSETGLDATWLELEITESVLMRDAAVAQATLTALHERGVGLAIDDFGTGWSSLLYLRNYPVDRIKIAREFVTDIATQPNDEAIAATVIAMARALDMQVIAEGVETEEQAEVLCRLGCPEVQGFLYWPPLLAAQFEELLD